jgi:hypothetical protein
VLHFYHLADRSVAAESTVLRLRKLVRQFDSVGVFPITLVLLSKHLFQPLCLFFGNRLIYRSWVVADEKLFAATVTSERSHLLEVCCFLTATLFYRYRPHLLILD